MPEKPVWNNADLAAAAAKLRTLGDLLDEAERAVGAVTSRLLAADANLLPPPAVQPAAAVPRPLPIETLARIEDTASRLKLGGQVAQAVARAGARHLRELTTEQAAALIAWLDKQAQAREDKPS